MGNNASELNFFSAEREHLIVNGTRLFQGTDEQSSAELMATSSYPSHPYKSKPPDTLPPSLLPWSLFPWHKRILSNGDSVLIEAGRRFILFIYLFFGGGGCLFVGRLSGVSAKACLCVGERGKLFTHPTSAHKPCQWSINMTMGGGLWWGCLTRSLGLSALCYWKWSFCIH